VFRQNQINTNINVRTPKGITIFGFYSANWADSNISSITDPFNSSVDYGRAAFAVRNRMVLGGSVLLPYKFTASPMIFAQSGSPYNVSAGIPDAVTLGYGDRPSFNTNNDMTAANANCFNASSFSNSTPSGPPPRPPPNPTPRGGGFGSSSDRKYTLTIGAQAQNLFNEVPYGIPVSTLTNPRFGQALSIGSGPFASQNAVRTIMLQASFSF
jgi:hypothetical protein